MTQQSMRRFVCDGEGCSNSTMPLWGYPAAWAEAKRLGWLIAVTLVYEKKDGSRTELLKDFCPACASKVREECENTGVAFKEASDG